MFGLMIAPLGIISIAFIIIQPIVIGTWSTIALIGAAAVLVQIPYSLDELLATLQFFRGRIKAGRNWLRVLLFGDTDEMPESGAAQPVEDEFDRSLGAVLRSAVIGGVNLPWNLALSAMIGLSLMFTRLTLGTEGNMANADHVIGALVLTVISVAAAEVARPARYLNVLLGGVLFITPFAYEANLIGTLASIAAGTALIVLSFRHGEIRERYGDWNPF